MTLGVPSGGYAPKTARDRTSAVIGAYVDTPATAIPRRGSACAPSPRPLIPELELGPRGAATELCRSSDVAEGLV